MASVLSKKCSIAAVSALVVAGSTLLAPPAQAVSGNMVFVCTTPLGDKEFVTVADTNLPDTLPEGQTTPVTVTAKVTIPADVAGAAYNGLGARTVEGTAVVKSTLDGAAVSDINETIPSTPVPASGPLTVTATGSATPFTGSAGAHVFKAVSYTATLVFKKQDGSEALTVNTTCTPKVTTPAQDLTVDTVTVLAPGQPVPPPPPATKAATTTKLTAKYARASGKAIVKATVRVADASSAAGRITLVLRRGTRKIKSITATVSSSGAAKAVFKKVTKKGKYTVTGSFAGSATVSPSTGKVTFKVR